MEFLTIFPYLAIYSESLSATYASFGGGGHIYRCYSINTLNQIANEIQPRGGFTKVGGGGDPEVLLFLVRAGGLIPEVD